MLRRRVVITGMGIVSSAGVCLDDFTNTVINGERALFPIDDNRIAHLNAKYAGLIKDDIKEKFDKGEYAFFNADRYVQLAALSARQAIIDAGIKNEIKMMNAGLFLGTCSGPMLTIEEQYKNKLTNGTRVTERSLFERQYYSASVLLADFFGIAGPVITVTTACSAFVAALSKASDLIRLGIIDLALVGGSDSFCTTTLAGFAGLKATTDNFCAPFSIPAGLNLGEGAGFLVIERRDSALTRGAIIRGEILGYGLSNDAYHCSAPDPSGKGAAQSMMRAIINSKISVQQISFISAHGTGTIANDKAETKAVKRVFGDDSVMVPVSSTKGAVGHCLGAAGAVETIATLVCSSHDVYPPTVGYTGSRDGCSLDYIPDSGRKWKKKGAFIKNNFAFGGNNASVIIANGEIETSTEDIVADDPVCIAGIGFVSSAGIGRSFLNDCVSENVDRKGTIADAHGTYEYCKIPPFDLKSIDKRLDCRSERSAQLASIAAVNALASAGIPERLSAKSDLGLYMSIAQGSTWAEQEHITSLLSNNYEIDKINVFPYIVPNSVTGTVCRALSFTGHNITFCNGHGAGLTGLGMGWAAINNDHAPMLLCGSVDDLTERGLVDCILSEYYNDVSFPFGEGAAMFLLEKLSHLKSRGAKPLCYIKSFVYSFEKEHEREIKHYSELLDRAMSEAQINRNQIAAICYNSWDQAAGTAVKSVFGTNKAKIIDCVQLTGYAPASLPLFNISAALNDAIVEFESEKKYILTFFNAKHASDCVAVFEKVS